MTPTLIEQLSPDRSPPPLGWWPLAPGWWGVLALLLLAIAVTLWWRIERRKPSARRWQRAALRELARLQAASGPGAKDDAAVARGVQQVLRRFAVARYGRARVAALSGEAWIAFVVAHGGTDWAGGSGQRLLRSALGDSSVRDALDADRERCVSSWISGARAFVRSRR